MKTTIDIPEDVLHRAKITAARRKTTLKAMILSGLNVELSAERERGESADQFLSSLSIGRNTVPVGRLKRDELYDHPILR